MKPLKEIDTLINIAYKFNNLIDANEIIFESYDWVKNFRDEKTLVKTINLTDSLYPLNSTLIFVIALCASTQSLTTNQEEIRKSSKTLESYITENRESFSYYYNAVNELVITYANT